ncbi:MAG: cytochrome C biogenesis protein [Hyphomicrobiales bacterium]|nr:cytochrome c biogenesis protein CcdA [Hyphomicrobiales bacterium]PCJ89826.1 MAG: cytochrome C biogenesis protein [Hyphomicrobiales bacterium]
MTPDLTLITVVFAGLVSFISPCVLPLVPPYLCYLAGVSLDQLTDVDMSRERSLQVVLSSIAFVAGFTTVFVLLGAVASVFGQFVARHAATMSIIAGVAIIIMGLHFLGVFRIALLFREARIQVKTVQPGYLGGYVMGLAFAFGWTPCIGPVLAAILAVAGTEDTVAQGAGLLAAYSLGLGIPFITAAFFAKPFIKWMAGFKQHMQKVERVMGALLVITGFLFLTNQMSVFSFWMLEMFPGLGSIG